jgi:alkanesulfonate monooxygenase SsuD/methylene tetrahydromethanopterin reductase-like flavin-dependent oxidoreductase (luciferase family)
MPDHFGDQLAPVPALAAVAAATTTLRLGSLVFGNDYRHPVVLAKEAATLDVLSDGRFELSLGAGWMKTDYEEAGIDLRHPEGPGGALRRGGPGGPGLLRTDGPYSFDGAYYQITGTPSCPGRSSTPGPPHHRRRRQAGALLRGPSCRHREHQRQPARGHRRSRDGARTPRPSAPARRWPG